MDQKVLRVYNCMDEDVPPICSFAASNLKRDQATFTAYSPKFNLDFLSRFESDIALAYDIIEPQSEMQLQKAITARMYGTIESLQGLNNRLGGYIQFAKLDLIDFGTAELREAIHDNDADAAVKGLNLISKNLVNYKDQLVKEGLTDEFVAQLDSATKSLIADKKRRYEIFSNRALIVQDNIGFFNELYKTLTMILTAGKILYQKKDPAKVKEYTFSELKKRVSRMKTATTKTKEDKSEKSTVTA